MAQHERRTSWLSLGFEELVRSAARGGEGSSAAPYDVLIVGTGYGGAMAAAELAGTYDGEDRKIRVCVLERGSEYLPGMFPTSVDDLAGHVRFSRPRNGIPGGRAEGLFDVRLAGDVTAVVANGLGGGSLINAGVMLRPEPEVLDHGFPSAMGGNAGLAAHYDDAERVLGAKDNSFKGRRAPLKADALRSLASAPGACFGHVPITVALDDARFSSGGVALNKCVRCGDCATGCNFGAKVSLDVNLLVRAADRGAEIYTGATVLSIARAGRGWLAHAVPTDAALRERHGKPLCVHARRIVLAAGTFGSTEILLRSRTRGLQLSACLGHHFSTNGDMLAAVYGHKAEANAVANEEDAPATRHVGPTITSMLDFRRRGGAPFAVQEMAVPGPLRRLFEEIFTTAHTLQRLARPDFSVHRRDEPATDPCAVDAEQIRRTSVIAMMGDDGAGGTLQLDGDQAPGDGAITVKWAALKTIAGPNQPAGVFDRQLRFLESMVRESGAGGVVLANPLWSLLPANLGFLLEEKRGPPVTVHPLGGCRMGDDAGSGVVNHLGQVFDVARGARELFDDEGSLVVLDGSIVPKALAINPALTIAAIALRAARGLRECWGLDMPPELEPMHRNRPVFKVPEYAARPEPTFTFVERMVGSAVLRMAPGEPPREVDLELTLHFKPASLRSLMSTMRRRLVVDPRHSGVRVFAKGRRAAALGWNRKEPQLERRLDQAALQVGGLEGEMAFFHREPSGPLRRLLRGLHAYLLNRGLRDFWQAGAAWWRHKLDLIASPFTGRPADPRVGFWGRVDFASLFGLATRAGEARLFEYDLVARFADADVRFTGHKRLSYTRHGNLFEQLEDLHLTRWGGRPASGVLVIDLPYFAQENVQTPLARIETHPNLARSLVELASFGTYLLRVVVNVHVWSFRRPDQPLARVPQRLPGGIRRPWLPAECGLARPEQKCFPVRTARRNRPAEILLTRYHHRAAGVAAAGGVALPVPDPTLPPVLLIHGYSASGTTFAHEAVSPCLAEWLWMQGRDVWVLDMRTSCGMPTGADNWQFEDAAFEDIPEALFQIRRRVRAEAREAGLGRPDLRVDVVAHCMGAAMLSIAALAEPEGNATYRATRRNLHRHIRRVVLCQVGPSLEFSPINVARAYVMRYARHFFRMERFDFRVKDEGATLGDLLLDRFVSSLRYPLEERRLENPWQPWRRMPFAGTRHRIDALYGRAFSLRNLGHAVLDRIDDFFGPLSLETLTQALHMARLNVITDWRGRNVYLNLQSRNRRWTFPTLTLHADENGLVDYRTKERINNYFNRDEARGTRLSNPRVLQEDCRKAGHQDALIGLADTTVPTFRRIAAFLAERAAPPMPAAVSNWFVRRPWIGPIVGPDDGTEFTVAGASNPAHGTATYVIVMPVELVGNGDRERFRVWPPKAAAPAAGPRVKRLKGMYFGAVCDDEGWFSIRVPSALRNGAPAGVLVLLAYPQTRAAEQSAPGGDMMIRAALADAAFASPRAFHALAPAVDVAAAPVAAGPATKGDRQVVQGPVRPPPRVQRPILEETRELLGIEEDVHQMLAKRSRQNLEAALVRARIDPPHARAAQVFIGSCQYPNGLLDRVPAWKSYEYLSSLVDAGSAANAPSERLVLLTGDQIYSDATAGLFDPADSDDRYRRPHEAFLGQPQVRNILRQVPVAMMLDDHEIAENWQPGLGEPGDGLAAYRDFQRRAGPSLDATFPGRLWFELRVARLPIFVCDTRTQRGRRRADRLARARIMSARQRRELYAWLLRMNSAPETAEAPKLVVSPAIMFPRRLAMQAALGTGASQGRPALAAPLRSDAWDGFPWAMQRLLHFIARNSIRNVVFVSGDEHVFCFANVNLHSLNDSRTHHMWSLHASPLYAPFPFANADPADFPASERFTFEVPQSKAPPWRYACEVEASFFRQRGFAEIRAWQPNGRWCADVLFHDSDNPANRQTYSLLG